MVTYHPEGPGSCLSKFQNMKPVNRQKKKINGEDPAQSSEIKLNKETFKFYL